MTIAVRMAAQIEEANLARGFDLRLSGDSLKIATSPGLYSM